MSVWKFRNIRTIYPKYNLLDSILTARGLNPDLLADDYQLPSPYQLPGMEQSARRIAKAAADQQKVLIFGDYDCDGICSTLIMKQFLERCGARVEFYLPSRQDDGYGLRSSHVEQAVQKGFDLIITVDNGITAFQAAETAHSLGIDLVITDHHEPQDKIPETLLVDPKLPGAACYREYSGAGVAYLTCCAVAQLLQRPDPEDFLDLVSLATVVDVCPITGDNFLLARRGLIQMRNNLRPGLQTLLNGNRYQITGRTMGWILGPHINAAGRFGDPILAYNLLSSETLDEAETFASELKKINTERKNAVQVLKKECLAMYDGSSFPLLASPEWHEGIIGIAAGRVVEAVSRPAAVGAISGEEARFSARSLGKFDLVEALSACQSQTGVLDRFGGHKLAAGFSLDAKNISVVSEFLNGFAQKHLQPEDKVQWIEVDAGLAAVPPPDEVAALDHLEPHGKGNPEPIFYIKDRAVDVKNGTGWTLVRLSCGLKFFASQAVEAGQNIHTVLTLSTNEYRGLQESIGNAVDLRPFICTRDDLLHQYSSWRKGGPINEWAATIFQELGLARKGDNDRTSLYLSPTFLRFGIVKEGS